MTANPTVARLAAIIRTGNPRETVRAHDNLIIRHGREEAARLWTEAERLADRHGGAQDTDGGAR